MEKTITNKPSIKVLLRDGNTAALKNRLEKFLPNELAELVSTSDGAGQWHIFKAIDRDRAYQTFELLDFEVQHDLLHSLPVRWLQLILNDMSPDKRTELLEQLDTDTLNRIVKLLTSKEKTVALSLLGYPEESIGRLMTPDYIAVSKTLTIKEVLDFIREEGDEIENLDFIFVIDEKGILIDDISARRLLIASPEQTMEEIMDHKYVVLSVTDDEEVAVNVFKKYNRTALPVTDANGLLLGIVTVDDVMKLQEEEVTEDIQKIGGVEALEKPYMETNIKDMIKKRSGWLIVLFISEMFTATAMGYFANEIEKAVVLALFVPLIVSSGGNSGSQAATLIIRAMALGEVTLRDWFRIMKRELVTGILLGVVLGAIGFMRITAWTIFTPIYGPHWVLVAMTVGISLIGVVTWGSIMGSMLPLLLKRFGADPAVSSAPFIATLVDVTGVIIYFSVAMFIMKGTLL